MDIRKLVTAIVLAGAATVGSTNVATARTYIDIDVAPPPPRVEAVPPPRVGYVWVPGNWYWEGRHHAWHHGHWVRERHGYAYVPPRWHQEGDRWRFEDGRWERHRG